MDCGAVEPTGPADRGTNLHDPARAPTPSEMDFRIHRRCLKSALSGYEQGDDGDNRYERDRYSDEAQSSQSFTFRLSTGCGLLESGDHLLTLSSELPNLIRIARGCRLKLRNLLV